MRRLSPAAIKAATCGAGDTAGSRFAFGALRIQPDGSVEATNGRVVIVAGPDSAEVEDDGPALAAPVLVEAGAVAAIVAAEARAGSRYMPGRIAVDVPATNANGHVALRGDRSGLAVDAPKVAGSLPPFGDVIPPRVARHEGGAVVVSLGIEELESVVRAAKAAGATVLRFQFVPTTPAESAEAEAKAGSSGAPGAAVVRFDAIDGEHRRWSVPMHGAIAPVAGADL